MDNNKKIKDEYVRLINSWQNEQNMQDSEYMRIYAEAKERSIIKGRIKNKKEAKKRKALATDIGLALAALAAIGAFYVLKGAKRSHGDEPIRPNVGVETSIDDSEYVGFDPEHDKIRESEREKVEASEKAASDETTRVIEETYLRYQAEQLIEKMKEMGLTVEDLSDDNKETLDEYKKTFGQEEYENLLGQEKGNGRGL